MNKRNYYRNYTATLYYLTDKKGINWECTLREFNAYITGKEGREKYIGGYSIGKNGIKRDISTYKIIKKGGNVKKICTRCNNLITGDNQHVCNSCNYDLLNKENI